MEELQELTSKINNINAFLIRETGSTLRKTAIFYIQRQLDVMEKRKEFLEKLHLKQT